jgi:Kef-type K+ transport system membrane component KefB
MTPTLQLLLMLALIVVASKLAGHASRRLGLPVVFGEILAGLLLGPTLLNVFGWPVFAASPMLVGEGGTLLHAQVEGLAGIGVVLLMFVAGLETDLAQIRTVGKPAFWSALGGVLLPLFGGALVARLFGLGWAEALFIGTVLTATSVSISAQTLLELGHLRLREGATILAAAIIDDVLGILVLSLVIAFAGMGGAAHLGLPQQMAWAFADACEMPQATTGPTLQVIFTLLLMGAFFTVAYFALRGVKHLMAWAARLQGSYVLPALALALVLLLAVGAEYLGQVAAITGAYLAGVALARTAVREQVRNALHPFIYALFVPIFLMSIGLNTDASTLWGTGWLFVVVIVLVAIATKIIGCGLGARLSGFSGRDALRVGVGMISRGEVGLIIAQVGLQSGVIARPAYAAMVVMVLATTVITPLLLRAVFPPAADEASVPDAP